MTLPGKPRAEIIAHAGDVDLGTERGGRIRPRQRLRKCPIGKGEIDQFAFMFGGAPDRR